MQTTEKGTNREKHGQYNKEKGGQTGRHINSKKLLKGTNSEKWTNSYKGTNNEIQDKQGERGQTERNWTNVEKGDKQIGRKGQAGRKGTNIEKLQGDMRQTGRKWNTQTVKKKTMQDKTRKATS